MLILIITMCMTPILVTAPTVLLGKACGSMVVLETSNSEPNKTHHPTTRSRPVSMTSRNYNINPVIHVRPRS